ncbi:MAG TPA: M56 family metallopeptidase, partial [Allosphingosinicella sp.]|nr:M56 family metallopeptidase [Allosphingosinicella sp.]
MSAAADLLDLLVRSSLLLAMIWLAAEAVRQAGGSAAMRHLVWLLGFAALPLLPLLAIVMPPLLLPILPEAAPAPAMTAPAFAAAAAAGSGGTAPASGPGLGAVVRWLYFAVAAGLAGRLALGHFLLARLWRRARPAGDAHWAALTAGLAGALGISRPVALRIAADPAMPMTWGTLRPKILLPAEARTWSDERRRIVLLHELAHVSRRDSLSRSAATIVCALYWFHPAAWYAARRMRLEQEHACDDLVLALGAGAHAYARDLLEVAGGLRRAPILAGLPAAMARPSELERRLAAIVGRASRRRSSARFTAGSGAAALAATLLVATVAPVAAGRLAPPRPPAPVAPVAPLPPRAAAHPVPPVRAA